MENEGRGETFLRRHDQNDGSGVRRRFLCYVLHRATDSAVRIAITFGRPHGFGSIRTALLLIGGSAAEAACTCQCVDGQIQPVCDSGINRPMVCPPTVCRPPEPSVAPVIPPNVQSLGGSECKQAQVCDASGKCTWEQVCR
jgi:hypothetical protein